MSRNANELKMDQCVLFSKMILQVTTITILWS